MPQEGHSFPVPEAVKGFQGSLFLSPDAHFYSSCRIYIDKMVELFRTLGRVGAIQAWLVGRVQPRLGDWGEWIALRYLLKCRFDIVARNWRIKQGEVDLVAYEGDHLVFVEVKTKRGPTRLPPELNIDNSKRNQLEFLAYAFLGRHELADVPVRFDLIAIESQDQRSYEIRHYRGFM